MSSELDKALNDLEGYERTRMDTRMQRWKEDKIFEEQTFLRERGELEEKFGIHLDETINRFKIVEQFSSVARKIRGSKLRNSPIPADLASIRFPLLLPNRRLPFRLYQFDFGERSGVIGNWVAGQEGRYRLDYGRRETLTDTASLLVYPDSSYPTEVPKSTPIVITASLEYYQFKGYSHWLFGSEAYEQIDGTNQAIRAELKPNGQVSYSYNGKTLTDFFIDIYKQLQEVNSKKKFGEAWEEPPINDDGSASGNGWSA